MNIPVSYCRMYGGIFDTLGAFHRLSIPGRRLLYLVRDRAHSAHAVIGIAALNNCAVQSVPRDQCIGWSARGLLSALAPFSRSSFPATQAGRGPVKRVGGLARLAFTPFGVEGAPSARAMAVNVRRSSLETEPFYE